MAICLIIFISLVKDLIDCRNVSKTAKNNAKLIAGKVCKRVIAKLFQYIVTVEKSENISEEKLKNPDCFKSEKSILNAGKKAIKDKTIVVEKIIRCLKTKNRSSL